MLHIFVRIILKFLILFLLEKSLLSLSLLLRIWRHRIKHLYSKLYIIISNIKPDIKQLHKWGFLFLILIFENILLECRVQVQYLLYLLIPCISIYFKWYNKKKTTIFSINFLEIFRFTSFIILIFHMCHEGITLWCSVAQVWWINQIPQAWKLTIFVFKV